MKAFDPLATGQIAEEQLRDVVMRLPEPRREQLFQFGIVPAYVSSGHLDRGLLVHGGPGITSQGLCILHILHVLLRCL